MKKVLVGLSGGIDSAVAAYLLKKEGYEVEAVTMLIWKKDSPYPAPVSPNSCYNPKKEDEADDLRSLCDKIGIKHHVVNCSDLYEKKVLENFKNEYMNARTPNPCIWCNALIKFGAMIEEARKELDFDYFATGHYAKIKCLENGRYAIYKALDAKKDQSYFLSRLSQEQLKFTLFPLGDYKKEEIRKIDAELGFHKEGQTESQDFYGGDYADLIGEKERRGKIIFKDGKILGEHNGFWHYTIGQRKGLGIAYSEPLYVTDLDPLTNTVTVGLKEDTMKNRATAGDVNYMANLDFEEGKIYSVKVRSTSKGDPAHVKKRDDGSLDITFISPINAITPGQSAVIYDEDAVVASAIITK